MIHYPDVSTRNYSYTAKSHLRGFIFRTAILMGVLYWFQDRLMPILHQMRDVLR